MNVDQAEAGAADMCCASCGKSELDDIKLMKCDDCDLVNYCNDECKEDHLPHHESVCKERVAELRDEILFRQPKSNHLGDCPICCLPMPLNQKSSLYACCSTAICNGCDYANKMREWAEKLQETCPFCRHPTPTTLEESNRNKMKRVEKNDPVAIREIGMKQYYSNGDHERAFEYLTKAAELGDSSAHKGLSVMYREGEGVEKDEKRGFYHLEEAAIAGHPDARYDLAIKEARNGRCDRSTKHLIIAASLGYDGSIQALKGCYKLGKVSKEDFAAALRAHQAAVDATKSPQREEAAKYFRRRQLE